jgi:LysM repeat protein
MKKIYFCLLPLIASGCSPLTSSPYDGKYQLELTLHEVQTNLDDLRHDLNSFRTELQIVDGRMKHQEDAFVAIKNQELDKTQGKIEQLIIDLKDMEQKWTSSEKLRIADSSELRVLASYAKETSIALGQFKDRIAELELDLIDGQRRFEEISKLKGNVESLAKALQLKESKTYKVRHGDSLEKIAKANKTSVDKIKKLNEIQVDLIVIGQEIKIPSE